MELIISRGDGNVAAYIERFYASAKLIDIYKPVTAWSGGQIWRMDKEVAYSNHLIKRDGGFECTIGCDRVITGRDRNHFRHVIPIELKG